MAKFPYKVVKRGKIIGEASTLAEAEKAAARERGRVVEIVEPTVNPAKRRNPASRRGGRRQNPKEDITYQVFWQNEPGYDPQWVAWFFDKNGEMCDSSEYWRPPQVLMPDDPAAREEAEALAAERAAKLRREMRRPPVDNPAGRHRKTKDDLIREIRADRDRGAITSDEFSDLWRFIQAHDVAASQREIARHRKTRNPGAERPADVRRWPYVYELWRDGAKVLETVEKGTVDFARVIEGGVIKRRPSTPLDVSRQQEREQARHRATPASHGRKRNPSIISEARRLLALPNVRIRFEAQASAADPDVPEDGRDDAHWGAGDYDTEFYPVALDDPAAQTFTHFLQAEGLSKADQEALDNYNAETWSEETKTLGEQRQLVARRFGQLARGREVNPPLEREAATTLLQSVKVGKPQRIHGRKVARVAEGYSVDGQPMTKAQAVAALEAGRDRGARGLQNPTAKRDHGRKRNPPLDTAAAVEWLQSIKPGESKKTQAGYEIYRHLDGALDVEGYITPLESLAKQVATNRIQRDGRSRQLAWFVIQTLNAYLNAEVNWMAENALRKIRAIIQTLPADSIVEWVHAVGPTSLEGRQHPPVAVIDNRSIHPKHWTVELVSDDTGRPAGRTSNPFTLTKADKQVIDAFTDQRAGSSQHLDSDGAVLSGSYMGGHGLARWIDGKIVLPDTGSKVNDKIQAYIRKTTPRNWLADPPAAPRKRR